MAEKAVAKKSEAKEAKEALESLVAKMGPPHYDTHKYEEEIERLKEAL
jgi:hypothetical protein